ncbi:MAG: hypothetical protein ACTSRH_13240 [Promethearchaeota archaeon]
MKYNNVKAVKTNKKKRFSLINLKKFSWTLTSIINKIAIKGAINTKRLFLVNTFNKSEENAKIPIFSSNSNFLLKINKDEIIVIAIIENIFKAISDINSIEKEKTIIIGKDDSLRSPI